MKVFSLGCPAKSFSKINTNTTLKVSVYGVILVHIFPAFSRFRTEYGKILRIYPYSDRMRENADQNNSEYGHFLRSVKNKQLQNTLKQLKSNVKGLNLILLKFRCFSKNFHHLLRLL